MNKMLYNIYVKLRKEVLCMGLDNGVDLRIKDREAFGELKTPVQKLIFTDTEDYEVFYWRKCWNVRNKILESFLQARDGESCDLSLDDLNRLCALLEEMYDPAIWDEAWNDGLTIWNAEEILDHYQETLAVAKELCKELLTKPEGSYRLFFYDSY